MPVRNTSHFDQLRSDLYLETQINEGLKSKPADYELFKSSLALRVEAAKAFILRNPNREINPLTKRWIESNYTQRQFAVHTHSQDLPYRFEEIPKGAVMLTDPTAFVCHLNITHKGSLLKRLILKVKAFFTWLFTGRTFTHAELSLGGGKTLDLTKAKNETTGKREGVLKIQDRSGQNRVFFGTLIVPEKSKMVEAYNTKFPSTRVDSFEDLFTQIDQTAHAAHLRMHVSGWDILKTGIPSRRPKDYDPSLDWNPDTMKLGCSPTLSALFAKFGIDIGKQFNKVNKNVTPTDFYRSHFFTPIYEPSH